MKTSRQRLLKAFAFDNPDKLPVIYHPSRAGLYVHGKKLLDLFNQYPPDNYVVFDRIPQPSPDAFDKDGRYHEFIVDDWSVKWEYKIFGIQGHPMRFPLENWGNLKDYKLPPLPKIDRSQIANIKQDYLLRSPVNVSLFEKLHALRPFEQVLMDIYTSDVNLMRFLDTLQKWYADVIAICLEAGFDYVVFGDDWGTQNGLIISPDLFRKVFKPRLARLIEQVHKAQKRVVYHACGKIEELFADLVEIGIDGLWHQIGLYDAAGFAQKAAEANVLLFLHMDRQQLIPHGSPQQIKETVKRYSEIHKAQGGGAVFYIEIENDAPFENVKALIESVHEYR